MTCIKQHSDSHEAIRRPWNPHFKTRTRDSDARRLVGHRLKVASRHRGLALAPVPWPNCGRSPITFFSSAQWGSSPLPCLPVGFLQGTDEMADGKTPRDCTEAKMKASMGVKWHHPKLPSLYAQTKGLQTEY